jgi:hypothetical protein
MNTAWTAIAAGKMGVRFYSGVSVAGTDAGLLSACQAHTPAGSTWPEGCSVYGLTRALSATFSQNWVADSYDAANQNMALSRIVNGLAVYKSPALVPIWGNADHWVTVFEVRADRSQSPYALQWVKYFDAGSPGPSALDPYTDSRWNAYENGLQMEGGSAWKGTYYKLLDTVAANDPYYNRYVVAIDPPVREAPVIVYNPTPVVPVPLPGVLREGEQMTAELAADRVWEALFLASADEDPMIWDAIQGGAPGEAWPVYGQNLDGDAMDYYLVPILDEEGLASALVRLSMSDGAFEHLWVPTHPVPFLGVRPEEAATAAREVLAEDEALVGGELVWDARRAYARSPLLPYYEFHIQGSGAEYRGSVSVALADGGVRGIERSLPVHASFQR